MFYRFFAKTGKLHERMILYYPGWMSMFTGVKEREIWFGHGVKVNNQRDGYWINFDDAGNKSEEGYFQQGTQTGHWIKWRPDGSKESEGEMQANQLHGPWTFYGEDGSVHKGRFERGFRVQ